MSSVVAIVAVVIGLVALLAAAGVLVMTARRSGPRTAAAPLRIPTASRSGH